MNDMMKSLRDTKVEKSDLRVMVIGAHPDDADNLAGGTAVKFARAGARVRFVSACNGDKGHHEMTCEALAERRRGAAARAAAVFGIERYDVMDTPDCVIEPSIALRAKFTRLIREFAPHLIFTHRLCDYHADHRATSQIVQDVAYMLGVPRWCPDVPIPDVKPAIFFLSDEFTSPRPFRADAIVPIDDVMDQMLDAMAEHVSQFFEWLPFDMQMSPEDIPPRSDVKAVREFVDKWWCPMKRSDAKRFADKVREFVPAGPMPRNVEAFEMSEYGRTLSHDEIVQFFSLG